MIGSFYNFQRRGVLLLVVLVLHASETLCATCVQSGQCACTYDDGSGTVDLSPIASTDQSNPLIRDAFAPDTYAYSFNPCLPFTEGTCVNAAACQFDTNGNIYYNIGDSSKVTLANSGTTITATYVADDGARQSKATFTCDPNKDPPDVQALGETSQSFYEFAITTKYACASSGPGPGPGPGPVVIVTTSLSISVGWILTILFLGVGVTYLVAGVVFNRFYRHNAGREQIPNINFWIAIPGLIKDGCLFVVGKVKNIRGGYQKY
ncbi:cation-dependent mannose-6-phosphate receptor-like [Mya arenaria]|uniref:cation-dependent mannose-6-phosphate receptor-like n=1 Tax=Mya arenaria TaxID=6604 RepID=UPI0022E73D6B|nr:cation-dependent mannose-6-phosphate receptor-like [Mya arenaria]